MCFLEVFQQAHRMACHAAAVTGKAKVFFRGCLHIDLTHIQLQNPCDILPHGGNVVFQLGTLSNHGHIDIGNFIACFRYLLANNSQ